MEAAKIFESGEGQAAPPPKGFRFEDSEVPAKRRGETLILVPKEAARQTLSYAISGFSDDFMADGRPPEIPDVREELDSSLQPAALEWSREPVSDPVDQ